MVRVMDRPLDVRRIYVDAVVELRTEDVRALEAALQIRAFLRSAQCGCWPCLECDGRYSGTTTCWTRLPQVRAGAFGRAVIAVSQAGHQRIASLPPPCPPTTWRLRSSSRRTS